MKMRDKINNVIRIPTSLNGKFFRYWLEFLRPFHNLSDREVQIATSLLRNRYELSKVITDDEILDRVLLSEDTRKKIMAECNIASSHLQVIMTKLRKSKVIVDNRINPKFIPNIVEGRNSFSLLLHFDLNNDV